MTTSPPSALARLTRRIPLVPASTKATQWLLDHGYLRERTLQVLEFPKSGGTWLAKLLSTTLEWPFLDDTPMPPGNNCVLRSHAMPSPRTPDLVYLVRDPRDAYTSLFHHRIHHWKLNSHYRHAWLEQHEEPLDADHIREQLPQFLEFESAFAGRRGSASPATWGHHVDAWHASRATTARRVLVSYEALRADTAHELTRIYHELFHTRLPHELADAVSTAHSITLRKQMTGHAGIGRSYIRSGQLGGWRETFSRRAGATLDRMAGDQMVALGYAADRTWWHDLNN